MTDENKKEDGQVGEEFEFDIGKSEVGEPAIGRKNPGTETNIIGESKKEDSSQKDQKSPYKRKWPYYVATGIVGLIIGGAGGFFGGKYFEKHYVEKSIENYSTKLNSCNENLTACNECVKKFEGYEQDLETVYNCINYLNSGQLDEARSCFEGLKKKYADKTGEQK
ncbi:MAG: hypothetical protein QXP39_02050 [Candidatus Aenigmatarchaeota archaeon]